MAQLKVRSVALVTIVAAIVLRTNPSAQSGPSISSVSGQWVHQGSVTISGSAFGSKATAAPVVWDDSSSTSLTQKWDGGWPDHSANSTYNIAYRTPIRGIPPPHQRVGRYLAGAHAEGTDYNAGYNVMVWKNRTATFPGYTYLSFFQRSDDAWVFHGDSNYKTYDWSLGAEPYNLPNNWYAEYNPRPTSKTSDCSWHLNDDLSPGSLVNPSAWWGGPCSNPMRGAWSKIEFMIKWSKGSDGFIRIYDQGQQILDYSGQTDGMTGNQRSEAIGGYARTEGGDANDWRYFTDIYLDYTLAHVVLGNASTFSSSTIREVQVPASWSSSAITIHPNLGVFSSGQTAYLYVTDANGTTNSAGYPVTVGGGSTTVSAPAPPTNLHILP
jgi:hypothetical protein